MKNPELYKWTIDTLVEAYKNDTLVKGNCCACAVGNMIAKANGINYTYEPLGLIWKVVNPKWQFVFITEHGSQYRADINNLPDNCKKGIDQLKSTNYEIEDLMKIEFAFETAPQGSNKDETMFNGLMAVVDVLDIIHENTDYNINAISKSSFNKQPVKYSNMKNPINNFFDKLSKSQHFNDIVLAFFIVCIAAFASIIGMLVIIIQ